MSDTALLWYRRDLRVHDHPALTAARRAGRIACVFVAEPSMLAASDLRTAYLAAALGSLSEELTRRGGELLIVKGPAEKAVPSVARAIGADVVHATADVTPRATRRDRDVADALDVPLELHAGLSIHEPGEVTSKAGHPYKVFTPYHRRWEAFEPREIEATPRVLHPAPYDGPRTDITPTRELPAGIPTGERAARAALQRFVAGRIGSYDHGRHDLDGSGGSRLSAALRFGVLSPVVAMRAAEGTPGGEAWIRQLAWRDFAYETVATAPRLLERSLRMPRKRWRNDHTALTRWRNGITGEPVVDAAMNQLAAQGWISNRARMVVGSWLVRDNGIDWREGARHFMRTLIDGDPSINAFNWQWVGGTGWDAPAPFWRLAPATQGSRYDPDGSWARRWSAA